MSRRKFYNPAQGDIIVVRPVDFVRYDQPHRRVGPFTVERWAGEWEIRCRVEGPMTYGGMLVTRAADPVAPGGSSLLFRTKRDAVAAMRLALPTL